VLSVGVREGGGQPCSQGKRGEARAFLEDWRNLSPSACAASSRRVERNPAAEQDCN